MHLPSKLCFLLMLLPSLTLAGNDCSGPVTGMIADSTFNFTYESWRKEDTTNLSNPFYRFERCVYNGHAQALWFDWKNTGLENRIVEGGDSAVLFFNEERDDKEQTDRDLWYGPRPAKIAASTVLLPKEAMMVSPKFWLAQGTPGNSPANIFKDAETLSAELSTLGAEGILRSSGTKVTIPADAAIGQRVRLENGDVSNGDLLGIWIILRERIFLGEGGPESTLELTIEAAPADYVEFLDRGNDAPVFRISTDIEMLQARLPRLGSNFVLSSESPFFVGADTIQLIVGEDGSELLESGNWSNEGTIMFTFNRAEVSVTFPVMLSRYVQFL